jgi:hypothetical protein
MNQSIIEISLDDDISMTQSEPSDSAAQSRAIKNPIKTNAYNKNEPVRKCAFTLFTTS